MSKWMIWRQRLEFFIWLLWLYLSIFLIQQSHCLPMRFDMYHNLIYMNGSFTTTWVMQLMHPGRYKLIGLVVECRHVNMASLIWSPFTTVSSSAERTLHLTPCNESSNILFECTWHNSYLELSVRMKHCTLFSGHHARLLLLEPIKQYSSQVTANSPWFYASLRWVIQLILVNELAWQCAYLRSMWSATPVQCTKCWLGDVWNGFNCWESLHCYPDVWYGIQYWVEIWALDTVNHHQD